MEIRERLKMLGGGASAMEVPEERSESDGNPEQVRTSPPSRGSSWDEVGVARKTCLKEDGKRRALG